MENISSRKRYGWSYEGLENLANDFKIPLQFEDLTDYSNLGCPHFELVFFERHKEIIEEYIYYHKPVFAIDDLISVPNEIGFNKNDLIEYRKGIK